MLSQILRILNQQEGTSNINQVVNNPISQQDTMNNIPKGILPTSYVLLAAGADTVPLRLQAVPPPPLILDPSNNVLVRVESLSDTSVRNDNIPDPPEAIVFSNGSCLTIDLNSNPSNKDGIQDSEKRSKTEKINDDTQESTAKEINSNSLVFGNSKRAVSNNDEDIFMPRSKFDEELRSGSSDDDYVENPPRKRIRIINHTESLFLREDEGGLVKVIERQNHILEGMARTLAKIEKSLKERYAEEAQRKNIMLVKISDNLDLLGESLKTVSKSLKSIREQ